MNGLFLKNKYESWYQKIIKFRQLITPNGYYETHHIMPKSIGGSNESTNLVKLTAREHFVAHRLLVKMLPAGSSDQHKMAFALHKMVHGLNKEKYAPSSIAYETIRQLAGAATSFVQTMRLKDPILLERQRAYYKLASEAAARRNTNNVEFGTILSERSQERVSAGTHNLLNGEIQKASWENPICREKHKQYMKKIIDDGKHIFQQPKFIEEQSERTKSYWANMSVEDRILRGKKISAGIKKAKENK